MLNTTAERTTAAMRARDRVVGVAELAEVFGRDRGTIRRWLRHGRLPRAENSPVLGVWLSDLMRHLGRDRPLFDDADADDE